MRLDSRRKSFTAAKRATAEEANTMIEEKKELFIVQKGPNIMNYIYRMMTNLSSLENFWLHVRPTTPWNVQENARVR
jgi:hypothetical protein